MSTQFLALVTKLKEVFQIDRPDLDFGVYRILNSRSREIEAFLTKRLKEKVDVALKDAGESNGHNELKNIEETLRGEFGNRAFDDAGELINTEALSSDLGKRYLEAQKAPANRYTDESVIYQHLLTFFSRYYDEGDFISQRRYKGDTYAIPYAGEEVMLHWANKDQYYTKSGEQFSNYRIKLADGRTVLFRLVEADTARENRKDNDKNRCFSLIESPRTIVKLDEEGEEYEEILQPFEVINGELVVLFEYKAFPTATKQAGLNGKALEILQSTDLISDDWKEALFVLDPTEKDNKRSLIQKHLDIYSQKNTADYFIHKDLGKFLRNELDFYIKNEVMSLDDVASSESFSEIERQLIIIKILRKIGLEIISFLASLEDFQKKLWLKKKFVVSSDYSITLDRVDEKLYPLIVENNAQWDKWEELGFKDQDAKIWQTEEYLKENQFMMLDTSLFANRFKYQLINSIESLDEKTDGIIIHSDNFQALNLLQKRYKESIHSIHIDPPYNTDTSGFIYKNTYKHSSWLSFMSNRLEMTECFLNKNGQLIIHIDENEYENLFFLQRNIGLINNGTMIWDKRNPMNGGSGLALQHEYILFLGKKQLELKVITPNMLSIIEKAESLIGDDGNVDSESQKKFSKWINNNNALTGGEKAFKYLDEEGVIYQSVSLRAPEYRKDAKFHIPLIHPVTKKDCPVPPNGFSRTPETLSLLLKEKRILFGKNETTQPRLKSVLTMETRRQPTSIYQNAFTGTADLKPLGLNFPYCHPISNYEYLLKISTESDSLVLDYFAGSGTTAHATIELNREDDGKRKYILVEQGEYFNTVLKPRIQKVIYSQNWKDGKPLNPETGMSHCLKVMKLESYEDTLNNLELVRGQDQKELFENDKLTPEQKDDYLMHYMLNFESQGSILSVKDFYNPFDYTMKITVDSAGAYEKVPVDLIETFNYLIGLEVRDIDYKIERGYVQVTGTTRDGEYTTIIWRDCEKLSYSDLNALIEKLKINATDSEYDLIYVNGDHNIANRNVGADGTEKTLKIRSIENDFMQLMFEEQ